MDLEIKVGNLRFVARLETEAAPKTCHAFQNMLPLEAQLIQARWSGEAAWIPFGELELAERDPRRLAAPARLDQLGLQREHVLERVAGLGRRLGLQPGDEAEVADLDL